jgi:hypothetical protein
LLTPGIRDDGPATTLEEHHHYTRRHKRFGVMEPNTKFLIEKLMKQMWEEIKEGFASHGATIDKCFAKISASE